MTTLSGFIKNEVYDELYLLLIQKNRDRDKNENRSKIIQALSPILVELSLTQNEIHNLLSFCIDYYCKHILTKNPCLQGIFIKTILDLYDYQHISFEKKINDTYFYKLISDLIVFLSLEKHVDNEHDVWHKIHMKIQNNDLIKEYEAEYMYHDQIFLKYAPLFPNIDGCISNDLFRKICVLLYCIKNNEIDVLQSIIYQLFSNQVLFSSKDKSNKSNKNNKNDLTINYFVFPEIHYMKPSLCLDILWVIWKGILMYIRKYHSHFRNDIKGLFKLSQIGYQKKNRKTRILLLIHILFILTNENKELKKKDKYKEDAKDIEHWIEKVSGKIDILFVQKKEQIEKEKKQEYEEILQWKEQKRQLMREKYMENKKNQTNNQPNNQNNHSFNNNEERTSQKNQNNENNENIQENNKQNINITNDEKEENDHFSTSSIISSVRLSCGSSDDIKSSHQTYVKEHKEKNKDRSSLGKVNYDKKDKKDKKDEKDEKNKKNKTHKKSFVKNKKKMRQQKENTQSESCSEYEEENVEDILPDYLNIITYK